MTSFKNFNVFFNAKNINTNIKDITILEKSKNLLKLCTNVAGFISTL
jgi:hypothetical protein